MRDVPWVIDWYVVLCLEAYRAGSGDVCHPVGAFPHGRELVDAFPGEDSPEDKVTYLEGARAYVAAVVASQSLLVLGRPESSTAAQSVEEEQIIVVEVLLIILCEGKDPCGSMLDFRGEDCLSSIDMGTFCLTSRLGGVGADGPKHGW